MLPFHASKGRVVSCAFSFANSNILTMAFSVPFFQRHEGLYALTYLVVSQGKREGC